MFPSKGFKIPPIAFKRVVLPIPEGPEIAYNFPTSNLKLKLVIIFFSL